MVEQGREEIRIRLEKHGEVWATAEETCMALVDYLGRLSPDVNWLERKQLEARLLEVAEWETDATQDYADIRKAALRGKLDALSKEPR